ncbi:EF-hand domain-containing protein [Sphingomonas jaspsi]|uniref:EF-hand domain-containing protein n=1 Tax=Sphingomonas jaspsi TaxID=392409 RepID=UPI0004BB6903|nr:EF-hand domain-containing protein [Sphingomonas jaspsi]
MLRYVAGAASVFLLMIGGLLFWQGRAETTPMPTAPAARFAAAPSQPLTLKPIPDAPSADPKSKEEKRFARADKNEDGRITLAELVEPRRKPFAKLDLDHDGKLSFEEWAVRTIDKFNDADADKSKSLTPAEYSTTAPKRKAKPACSCS